MDLLVTGPDRGPTLVLAHGAGAGMESGWMREMASLLGDRGIRVVRFEFPYMTARRDGTHRPPPPRAEASVEFYRSVVEQVDAAGSPLLIGGKSYGGRVATLAADSLHVEGRVAGVVCFGYPFHPPGRPDTLRTAHLERLETPTLICQGTRDPFGRHDEVTGYALSPVITVHWLEDGDHNLTPRKGVTGRTAADNLAEAADAVVGFAAQFDTSPAG